MKRFLRFIDALNDSALYPVERLLSITCASNATLLMNFESSVGGSTQDEHDVVTLSLDNQPAATGIITIVDQGSDTTNINHLHGTTGFTITNTAGLAKEYIFDKNNALGATGTVDAEGIVIQVNGMTKASSVAAQVKTAIEHSNGHAGTILVSLKGLFKNILVLTQTVAGTAGNNEISVGSLPVGNYIRINGFTGGLDGDYINDNISACSITLDS